MSQVGETAVKVFGWTITSVNHHPLSPSSSSSSSCSIPPHMIKNKTDTHHTEEEENTRRKISSNLNKESKETSENSDDQHSEITTTTTSSEEKTTTLKKPDKILPCPRCKSADTKFCYYNNYNVNQPRHFCRNCQRYWTSGGSMRTVPVGSGRRKNKGWVSSDPSNDYTNNYNSSSTKILSFESAESLVTENGSNHRSSDANITANSVSQDFNNFQGFLPSQVTSPVSPLWPYQNPPNPSFYRMPVSWVPVWCTQETSTCLGKRTRETPSINNEASLATKNHLWHPIPTKREKTEHFSFFKEGSETKSNNMRFVPQTYLSLQANPAAMARSMSFRESM